MTLIHNNLIIQGKSGKDRQVFRSSFYWEIGTNQVQIDVGFKLPSGSSY